MHEQQSFSTRNFLTIWGQMAWTFGLEWRWLCISSKTATDRDLLYITSVCVVIISIFTYTYIHIYIYISMKCPHNLRMTNVPIGSMAIGRRMIAPHLVKNCSTQRLVFMFSVSLTCACIYTLSSSHFQQEISWQSEDDNRSDWKHGDWKEDDRLASRQKLQHAEISFHVQCESYLCLYTLSSSHFQQEISWQSEDDKRANCKDRGGRGGRASRQKLQHTEVIFSYRLKSLYIYIYLYILF